MLDVLMIEGGLGETMARTGMDVWEKRRGLDVGVYERRDEDGRLGVTGEPGGE